MAISNLCSLLIVLLMGLTLAEGQLKETFRGQIKETFRGQLKEETFRGQLKEENFRGQLKEETFRGQHKETFRGQLKDTIRASECDCTDQVYIDMVPFHLVVCENIDQRDEVDCVEDLLKNITVEGPVSIELQIGNSNVDVFPDDFLYPYPVYDLVLFSCNLREIPFQFIYPICFRLASLTIEFNEIDTIPANGFSPCGQLMYLILHDNRIKSVEEDAFAGLTNLLILDLESNSLTRLDSIPDLPNLEELVVTLNEINYVAKDAFENMPKMTLLYLSYNNISILEEGTFDEIESENTYVSVEGNPFYCNCSLKWLQEYLNQNPLTDNPICVGPEVGPLKTLDFCPTTVPPLSTIQPIPPKDFKFRGHRSSEENPQYFGRRMSHRRNK